MPDRPAVVDHNFVVNMTEGDGGARAVGLALVVISEQLDRVIQLLESTALAAEEEVLWCETCGERPATDHTTDASLCGDCALAAEKGETT